VTDSTDCPTLTAYPTIDQCLLSRMGTFVGTKMKHAAMVGLRLFETILES